MTETTTKNAEASPHAETHEFQAEVSRLLELVAHSLYSNKEIFLRELISNASDACDKLRYEALTRPELTDGDADLKIVLAVDAKARTLTVSDNGIGMNHDDLVENLGTIARSGTAAFVEALSGDQRKDTSLIGQFGVGFYSAFMVAERVEVTTRRAGESEAWHWVSDGKGAYAISPAPAEAPRGTSVVLHLARDQKEFLEPARIRNIVTAYSDHIGLPILLDEGTGDTDTAPRQVNAASALWTRNRSDIDAEQYKEFYHHVGHAFDEPWLTLHNRVEGKIEYTNLLFVPSARPFDLFNPERKNHIKLYVRRVFITDDCEDLLPAWLRFVRGVVDSADLPLNISREMLQHNPVLARIRSGLVKRVLGELKKKADKDADGYTAFWDNFGAVLKEGLYEPNDHRDALLALARFHSTTQDSQTSLADYVGRMKEGQKEIFYITGDSSEALAAMPQLEAFRARGIEVLLLTDPVDEFWVPAVGTFDDKPFRSATRGDIDLDAIAGADATADASEKADDGALASLTALLKLELKDAVKDIRTSHRLTDSAVCLVADEGDMDMHLEKLLRQHQQVDALSARILEINPAHPLIRSLAATVAAKGGDASASVAEIGWLLLDQARIVEGEALPDPAAFSRRLASVIEKGLAG